MSGSSPVVLFRAAAFVAAWEALGRILEVRSDLLPTPTRILLEMWREAAQLRGHAWITAQEILAGLFLALLCAVPLAILLALLPELQRKVAPFMSFFQKVPLIVLTPLFFVWLGYGIWPRILVVSSVCFFTITMGALGGLGSAPPEMIEMVRAMGAGWTQILAKIRLPASLPCTIGALKAAVPLAAAGAMVGEFVEADSGLGYLMMASAFKLETPLGFAALTSLFCLSLLLFLGVLWLERSVVPWRVDRAGEGGSGCGWRLADADPR